MLPLEIDPRDRADGRRPDPGVALGYPAQRAGPDHPHGWRSSAPRSPNVERELIEATIALLRRLDAPRRAMLEVSPSTLYRKLESWTGVQRRSGT